MEGPSAVAGWVGFAAAAAAAAAVVVVVVAVVVPLAGSELVRSSKLQLHSRSVQSLPS